MDSFRKLNIDYCNSEKVKFFFFGFCLRLFQFHSGMCWFFLSRIFHSIPLHPISPSLSILYGAKNIAFLCRLQNTMLSNLLTKVPFPSSSTMSDFHGSTCPNPHFLSLCFPSYDARMLLYSVVKVKLQYKIRVIVENSHGIGQYIFFQSHFLYFH